MASHIWVRTPDAIHNNPGLEIMSSDPGQIRAFATVVLSDPRFKLLHGFQQGTSANWRYMEFWTENQAAVLEFALDVARRLALDLDTAAPNVNWIHQILEGTRAAA